MVSSFGMMPISPQSVVRMYAGLFRIRLDTDDLHALDAVFAWRTDDRSVALDNADVVMVAVVMADRNGVRIDLRQLIADVGAIGIRQNSYTVGIGDKETGMSIPSDLHNIYLLKF